VTTTADSGAGSLRKAIADAASGDTINFNLSGCPCTITLTSGELLINKNLTIQGPGATNLTVSGNMASRVFSMNAGISVTLDGLRVSGGSVFGANGAGILNKGTLTITNSSISGNFASGGDGGGIYNQGSLNITNTLVSNNTASPGGGIYNAGTLGVLNSTFSGNNGSSGGGGIRNNGSTLTITNSTLSANSGGGGGGGGMLLDNGTVFITNTTISANTTSHRGGGIYNVFGALTVTNSTITGNRGSNSLPGIGVGGGINTCSGTLNNTIVAGNFSDSTPNDLGCNVTTANNNLIGDAATSAGITNGVNGNIVGNGGAGTINISTVLNTALLDNGGPTKTHALVSGSLAINAGNNAFAALLSFDQRGSGFPRVSSTSVDIGAFEARVVVTKTPDTNDGVCNADCSLREAIAAASAGDAILFSPLFNTPQTITLGSGQLSINKNLKILGTGADKLTVSGNNASRVFLITDGTGPVTLEGLTISGGKLIGDFGAGILNAGTLTVSNSVVSGNSSDFGAGGIVTATLNTPLIIINTTVSGNSGSLGGGIENVAGGPIIVTNSTISGNTATGPGGGIFTLAAPLIITNSTITGNRARSQDNTTLASGGGIYNQSANQGDDRILNNTIVVGNFRGTGTTPDDIVFFPTSHHNNLIGEPNFSPFTNGVNGNKVGVAVGSVLNTTLANNGGPTKTHAIFCGSPAVDAGGDAFALDPANGNTPLTTDQRGAGFPRKFGVSTDIGAFELQTNCNQAPTAVADSYSTDEDTPLTVAAPGVLGNDSDPNSGDTITAVQVSGPAHAASFTLNANGSFDYTPKNNFNGSDSFTYKARDNHNADSSTVTVSITINSVNDLPTPGDDTAGTNEDFPTTINVLVNDSDPDGDALTVSGVTQPAHGAAVINGDGSITYSPNANFNGSDSFTYTVDDAHGGTATATVNINIAPVNDPPSAANDSYSTNEDTPLSTTAPGVLGNDGDVDGDAISAALISGPSHAQSFTLNANGSFSYTPAPNYNGPDQFTYKANDGSLDSNVATVSINVIAVNDAPTVVVAPGGSCSDTTIISGTMNLTVGDVESPPGSLTLSGSSNNTSLVPNANIVFGGSGSNRTIKITVASKQTGTATITVIVSDGQATGAVTITVIVGSDKNETLNGTAGADMIFGLGGKNTINGNAGNDLICGGNGVDTISGGDGDDTIEGGNGDDFIQGDAGNDILIGGLGNDRLEGGADNDSLTGGSGADAFFGGPGTDTVSDFTPSQGDTQNGIP
jgi:CSLREA domain-containing protein